MISLWLVGKNKVLAVFCQVYSPIVQQVLHIQSYTYFFDADLNNCVVFQKKI